MLWIVNRCNSLCIGDVLMEKKLKKKKSFILTVLLGYCFAVFFIVFKSLICFKILLYETRQTESLLFGSVLYIIIIFILEWFLNLFITFCTGFSISSSIADLIGDYFKVWIYICIKLLKVYDKSFYVSSLLSWATSARGKLHLPITCRVHCVLIYIVLLYISTSSKKKRKKSLRHSLLL